MAQKTRYKEIFIDKASQFGFANIGFARARKLEEEEDRLSNWLKQGFQGSMSYLDNHFDLRLDPTKLVPDSKTVVSLLYNYYPEDDHLSNGEHKIARYAYGRDYHKVLKTILKNMLGELKELIGNFEARCFVDSAPVMERQWAQLAGLGWTGKNSLLINPKMGSYFMLAEIICDLEIEIDHAIRDHCGTCTKCIDACPTDAIDQNGYIMDASKCISYLTIERKDDIPQEFKDQMDNWIFGCDICQEVCPWNRFSVPHDQNQFFPNENLDKMSKRDWIEITHEVFDTLFHGSAVKRTKYKGLKRNIDFIST